MPPAGIDCLVPTTSATVAADTRRTVAPYRSRTAAAAVEIRAAIADKVPDILEALMARALDGDTGAARLLLERTIAPFKAVEPTQALALPDGTLTEQGRAVLASVAAGELAPSQGAALVGAIGALARVAEVDELAQRVAALEAKHGNT